MSKQLVTFSGKLGDVLWSLPTARAISQMVGEKVDFGTMPMSRSLLPLLEAQSYIDKAFVIEDWQVVNENHGAQPWNPPGHVANDYERCWHLTYKGHPGINAEALPLIDFIAHQQGLKFGVIKSPIPFIEVEKVMDPETAGVSVDVSPFCRPTIAYAFNPQYDDLKGRFFSSFQERLKATEVLFMDVSTLPWLVAAAWIKSSVCFVGCRSANYVLAHGVGQRVVVYEPHPQRNAHGSLGTIFGCPYGIEFGGHYQMPPEQQAEAAAKVVGQWVLTAMGEKSLVGKI